MGIVGSLKTLNLELTTACPLRCPQCYCTLEGGKHLDLSIAKKRIDEGVELGAKSLNLSGGETLCYPHLYELVAYASARELDVSVALSGAFFDQAAFDKLIDAGISTIHISLNGSCESVNSFTRQGFSYAIKALEILQNNQYENTIINWVMHSMNTQDFIEMLSLAERYHVSAIAVLSLKPDSQNALKTYPSLEQFEFLAKCIKSYSGPVKVWIESCFSNFLALFLDTKLFGNFNVGPLKGCTAGRDALSVDVDGNLTPCRHLNISENNKTMRDYWESSPVLKKLRSIENDCREPCSDCHFQPYCRHCQAISWQIKNDLFIGFEECPIYKPRR